MDQIALARLIRLGLGQAKELCTTYGVARDREGDASANVIGFALIGAVGRENAIAWSGPAFTDTFHKEGTQHARAAVEQALGLSWLEIEALRVVNFELVVADIAHRLENDTLELEVHPLPE